MNRCKYAGIMSTSDMQTPGHIVCSADMFQTKVSMTRPSKDERREVLPSSSFGNTAEQDAFINAPILGGSFVLENAVAGSGKTYSIVSRLREKREAAGPLPAPGLQHARCPADVRCVQKTYSWTQD